jgi:transposase/uncharacterized coiled-coil protein SlyX
VGQSSVPDPSARQAELEEKLARATAELTRAGSELVELRSENQLLREKIDALIKRLYGAQSEKIDPGQLLLMLQGLDAPGKAPEPVAAEAPRRSTGQSPPRERGPRIPEHLPVVEEVIDPEPVKACPQAWRCIGEEVTEQLDYEPAHFFKRRIVRRKYARRDHPFAAPVIAPLCTLQDRCLAAPGLIAAVIVGKYVDHLPLYRQEAIFATRHGVSIPRQTMAQWMGLAADWLRPIYEHIRTGVLGGGYVQVDETPIEYLVPGHGETKLGYLWACARPGGDTFFAWATSRAAACLETIIPANFRGTMQTDGYSAYPFVFTMGAPEPKPSHSPAAGHTRAGPFTKLAKLLRASSPGCCGRLLRSTKSNTSCVNVVPDQPGARPSALRKARCSCAASGPRCGASDRGTCRKARWAKPSPTSSSNGPCSKRSCATVVSQSTTTASRTPSARRPWGRKTGCSLAMLTRAIAERSSTPSWKAAAGVESTRRPTCVMSSPACPR